MTVSELISRLRQYNGAAQVEVIVDSMPVEFSLSYGSSDGCTKDNCDVVCILVDTTTDQPQDLNGYHSDPYSQIE